eukprot:SAG22_NODE_505_length_9680_cov_10.482831_5_plen_44_part_00
MPFVTADTDPTLDVLLIGEWHHVAVPGTEPTIEAAAVLDRQLL